MRNTMEIFLGVPGADSTAGRIEEEQNTGPDQGNGEGDDPATAGVDGEDGSMLLVDQTGSVCSLWGEGACSFVSEKSFK